MIVQQRNGAMEALEELEPLLKNNDLQLNRPELREGLEETDRQLRAMIEHCERRVALLEEWEGASKLINSTHSTTPASEPTAPHDVMFRALQERWEELYGSSTAEEVKQKIYARLMAAQDSGASS